MIDRGFAVVNAGSQTVRDTHSFPRLCVVQLEFLQADQVRLSSPDASSVLLFSLAIYDFLTVAKQPRLMD